MTGGKTNRIRRALRPSFRFSLRSLCLIMLAVAIVGGLLGSQRAQARRQTRTLRQLSSGPVLTLTSPRGPAWWQKSFGRVMFQPIRYLNLRYVDLGETGLAPLARLPALRQLELAGLNLTDDDLRHLAKLERLEALQLEDMPLTDAGLRYIRPLKRLKSLTLEATDISQGAIRKLQRSRPDLTVTYFE